MNGREAYAAIAEELDDPETTLDDLDQDVVKSAQEWAIHNHRKWPPRPTCSGMQVTVYSL